MPSIILLVGHRWPNGVIPDSVIRGIWSDFIIMSTAKTLAFRNVEVIDSSPRERVLLDSRLYKRAWKFEVLREV
jgi:hypothetical protein